MVYEDFTTYTEVDPNNHIAVAANELDMNDLNRNEDAYVYDDKGAAHFGNFEHLIDVRMASTSAATGAICAAWGLTNSIDDANNWAAGFYMRPNASIAEIRIMEVGGANDTYSGSQDTWYYLTIDRAGTTLTCKIYSDAPRTNLLDTLSIEVANTAYRYVYAVASINTGNSNVWDGDVDNLDLQEVAGISVPVAMHHYEHHINKIIRG